MAAGTRLVVGGSVLVVALLYYIAFWHFSGPQRAIVEPAIPVEIDQKIFESVDAIFFWTADLQQSDVISSLESWYLKEQPHITDGDVVPDYPYIRGGSFVRYFLRSVNAKAPWIRRVILITGDDINIPGYLNSTHPGLQIIRHEELLPQELLPCFNWRVAALYFHKIEGLSPNFVIFNEFNFVVSPLPESALFDGDIKATSIFVSPIPLKHSFDVEKIIDQNTRELVGNAAPTTHVDSRGPLLVNLDVWNKMLAEYSAFLDKTKTPRHRFRTKESINPVLLYALHLIKSSHEVVTKEQVRHFLQSFDKDKDGKIEGLELQIMAEVLFLQVESLIQLGHEGDGRVDVGAAVANDMLLSRARAVLTPSDVRYQLVPPITNIVDPIEKMLDTLAEQFSPKVTKDYLVYWVGPKAIFSKFYQVRGAVDTWLYENFAQPSRFEIQLDRWYNLSLTLAIVCLTVVPAAFFILTKALLVNSTPVHRD